MPQLFIVDICSLYVPFVVARVKSGSGSAWSESLLHRTSNLERGGLSPHLYVTNFFPTL